MIKSGEIDLIINTPLGKVTRHDDGMIRSDAYQVGIPCLTTMSAAMAAIEGMAALMGDEATVECLQRFYQSVPIEA